MLASVSPMEPVPPVPTIPSPLEELLPVKDAIQLVWFATMKLDNALNVIQDLLLTTSPVLLAPTPPSPTELSHAPVVIPLVSAATPKQETAWTVPLDHKSMELPVKFVSTELSPPEEMSPVRLVILTVANATILTEFVQLVLVVSASIMELVLNAQLEHFLTELVSVPTVVQHA